MIFSRYMIERIINCIRYYFIKTTFFWNRYLYTTIGRSVFPIKHHYFLIINFITNSQ